MKKVLLLMMLVISGLTFSSCCVGTYNVDTLRGEYSDTRTAEKNKDIQVFFDERDVTQPFEVISYGYYHPLIIFILRPERPRIERKLIKNAVETAVAKGGNAVIIDDKNNFRIIKYTTSTNN